VSVQTHLKIEIFFLNNRQYPKVHRKFCFPVSHFKDKTLPSVRDKTLSVSLTPKVSVLCVP
jgi:hypothetical protein